MGAYDSLSQQRDVGLRPRVPSRPCCSFPGQPVLPTRGLPSPSGPSPWAVPCGYFLLKPHMPQHTFSHPWGHQNPSPPPQNVSALLFTPLKYLPLGSFIGIYSILCLVVSAKKIVAQPYGHLLHKQQVLSQC